MVSLSCFLSKKLIPYLNSACLRAFTIWDAIKMNRGNLLPKPLSSCTTSYRLLHHVQVASVVAAFSWLGIAGVANAQSSDGESEATGAISKRPHNVSSSHPVDVPPERMRQNSVQAVNTETKSESGPNRNLMKLLAATVAVIIAFNISLKKLKGPIWMDIIYVAAYVLVIVLLGFCLWP
jgi:hypothetical protein